MGRGKQFNEQDALDKATQVFWKKGFDSASMAELIEGTGLNRGSLYNAYGGKQQLFVKALLNYDQSSKQMFAELEALDDPKKAIATLFDNLVEGSAADPDRKGCFMFNTALEIYAHDQQVRDIVTKNIAQIEAFFRRSIEVGQARGEIAKELVPKETAKSMLSFCIAIRVLSRGVFDKLDLQKIADQAKQIIGLPTAVLS